MNEFISQTNSFQNELIMFWMFFTKVFVKDAHKDRDHLLLERQISLNAGLIIRLLPPLHNMTIWDGRIHKDFKSTDEKNQSTGTLLESLMVYRIILNVANQLTRSILSTHLLSEAFS